MVGLNDTGDSNSTQFTTQSLVNMMERLGVTVAPNTVKVQKNHPTAGRIPDGALVEREVPYVFGQRQELKYRLKDSDFTTVSRMREAVNQHFGGEIAMALDAGQLQVMVPESHVDHVVDFVAELERLEVTPDTLARIVGNEKTGTIVMGDKVRTSTVAVSHGNLSLVISEQTQCFSAGTTKSGADRRDSRNYGRCRRG